MQTLFATSGIRGDAEKLLTNQFCFDVGRSFAFFLKKNNQKLKVAVGMDPRPSSLRIQTDVISGLIHEGIEVTNQGITPIPSINYILIADPTYGGSIMITGSHIKANLNGIKFFAFTSEITKAYEKEIDQIYYNLSKIDFKKQPIPTIQTTAQKFYEKRLLSLADQPYPKWRVVVDPGNGAQSPVAPKLFTDLGLRVVTVNDSLTKPILARDTEYPKDFQTLIAKVREANADFGIAYDTDGDRAVFVDEDGNYIPGDYSASIIAKYTDTNTIVTPVSTSQVIDHIGKKVIRTKVGSPQVSVEIAKGHSKFGFEANGGGIFYDMLSRDGGRTSIVLLNILKQQNKKLSELIDELPKFYNYKDKIDCDWKYKETIYDLAKKKIRGVKVEEIDGVKIWINNTTWLLFRASGNAAEFRVFAESTNDIQAKNLLTKGMNLVNKVIKETAGTL